MLQVLIGFTIKGGHTSRWYCRYLPAQTQICVDLREDTEHSYFVDIRNFTMQGLLISVLSFSLERFSKAFHE